MGLVEERIIESERGRVRMALGKHSAGDASRAAAPKRQFLPDGKMRESLEYDFFGDAANFSGRGRRQADLNQIEDKELA